MEDRRMTPAHIAAIRARAALQMVGGSSPELVESTLRVILRRIEEDRDALLAYVDELLADVAAERADHSATLADLKRRNDE